MKPGTKYHIVHKPIPGVWNKPREFIWTFADEDNTTYYFSARPKAGTQDVKKSDVVSIQEVPNETEIMMPRIFRGEWPK